MTSDSDLSERNKIITRLDSEGDCDKKIPIDSKKNEIVIRSVNWKSDFKSLIPLYVDAFNDQIQWFNIFQVVGEAHKDALYWIYKRRLQGLHLSNKSLFVATQNNRIIGAVGIEPNKSSTTIWIIIKLIFFLITSLIKFGFKFGLTTLLRVSKMTGGEKDNDPKGGKIGMMAVHPDFQCQGVGNKLLSHCLENWDAADGGALTLMTQLESSVRFYNKFGFQLTNKIQKEGYSNWTMARIKQKKE